MFIVRDFDWQFAASNFKGGFDRNFFDRDRQHCSKIFRKIEIRKIGNNLTIYNREKFWDRQMSSKNPVVSKNRRSNYPNWTVGQKSNECKITNTRYNNEVFLNQT